MAASPTTESSELTTLITTQFEADSQAMSTWLIMAADDNELGMQILEERFDDTLARHSTSGMLVPSMVKFHPGYPRTRPSTNQASPSSWK